jgi:hypothetical protein
MWLAVGLTLYSWIQPIACGISNLATSIALNWNIGVQWTGIIYAVCWVVVQAVGWLFVFRLVSHHSKASAGWVRYCFRNPLLPILAVLALNLNQGALFDWLIHLTKVKLLTPLDLARLGYWHDWGQYIAGWGYLIAFVYLVQRYFRSIGETVLKPATPALDDPAASPEVWSLQNQGLSKQEATFLVQLSQGNYSSGIKTDTGCLRRVWLERMILMMAAEVIFQILVLPMYETMCWMTFRFTSWLPANGHLLGAIGLMVQSALFLSLAVVAWKETTRPKNVFSQFADIMVKWPLVGALGLLCLITGGSWCLITCIKLFIGAFPITLQDNISRAYWEWHRYGLQFWLNVLPVLFVFWLGRQRLNLTVKELFVFRRD